MCRICLLFLFFPFCSLTFAQIGIPGKPGSDFNWITIWLSFFFGLLFTILFRFLNTRSVRVDQRLNAGRPFSGWVVFLGANLVLRMIIQAYFFLAGNYFLRSDWIHLEQVGGVRLHSLLIFEMFLSLFSLAGTGALLYWYLGKRDIFPRMFLFYAGFYLLAMVIQIFLNAYMELPEEMMGVRRINMVHLFRFAYAAAWIIFVWKSTQVKQTFVYPHG